jgi:3',5'-cyclic AMP phosphodiesterase CpdA
MTLLSQENHPGDIPDLRSFSFAQITDTHYFETGRPLPVTGTDQIILPNERMERVFEQIRDKHPDLDFVISTGDVCQFGSSLDAYRTVNEMAKRYGFPMYWTVGNHDNRNYFSRRLELGPHDNLLTEGKGKVSYTFQNGSVKGLVLDARSMSDRSGIGFVSGDALNWLDSQLAGIGKGEKAMLFTHYPFLSGGTPWVENHMKVDNGEEAHRVVERYQDKLLAVVHGHLHRSFSLTRDGVLYVCGPATSFALDWAPDSDRPLITREGMVGYNIFSLNADDGALQVNTYRIDMDDLV